MFEEIARAKKKAEEKRARQKKQEEERMKDREAQAMSDPKVEKVECDVCAEDRPAFHMASCNAKEKHTYCIWCVKTHIETIVGKNQYLPACMMPECKGFYPRPVLDQLLDKAAVSRMERLQQNAELENVTGMKACPICQFKAFCEASQFDCQNPECLTSSCLQCNEKIHPGLSCAASAKKKKDAEVGDPLVIRHLVEEAMTKALVRYCPRCNAPIIKETGCNMIRCSNCRTGSCYVCRAADIQEHTHFGRGKCPQFEPTEARHEAEVKAAEKAAKAKIKRDMPGVTDEMLDLAMSDNVAKDDKRRAAHENRFLRGEVWNFGMGFEGDDDPLVDMQERLPRLGRMHEGHDRIRPLLFPPLPERRFHPQDRFHDMRERPHNLRQVNLMRQQEELFNEQFEGLHLRPNRRRGNRMRPRAEIFDDEEFGDDYFEQFVPMNPFQPPPIIPARRRRNAANFPPPTPTNDVFPGREPRRRGLGHGAEQAARTPAQAARDAALARERRGH